MEVFLYGQKEMDYLKRKDKKLALAIDRIGMIERSVIPDLFAALVHSIVGQQISNKAVKTIWNRMLERFGEITPQNIAAVPSEEVQQCGLSMRKASYVKGICDTVLKGDLNVFELSKLPDEEIIKHLSSLHGIGVWTAEMIMIFSLQRPDIVSWGDLAIQRGMMLLYGHKTLDKTKFERYRKRYSPYGSVASFYLWEIAAGR
ncbi:MAG TPA: DNA-3-methyladenine glycosylase [Syntrophomonadaceae bacterium]|nr:DNA-3-methyladenine glycosylase [Syntrophomonadaceae bacterium]